MVIGVGEQRCGVATKGWGSDVAQREKGVHKEVKGKRIACEGEDRRCSISLSRVLTKYQ